MKKSSMLVIAIPILVVGLLIGGVFVLRTISVQSKPAQQVIVLTSSQDIPSLSITGGKKPVEGFGKLEQSSSPVSDLRTLYDASNDDGGAKNLNALQQQASAL